MAGAGAQFAAQFNRDWLAHSIRTTIAVIVSLYVGYAFRADPDFQRSGITITPGARYAARRKT